MPSAFALFASAPPASAGTPAAAPGGQDGETADLFSSTLADVFQGLSQTGAAKVETPHRAPGRLSLQTISATDLEAAEAPAPAAVVAETEVAVLPVASETPPSDAEGEPTDAAVEAQDGAPASLPQVPQVTVSVPVQTPAPPPSETASTDSALQGVSLAPAVQAGPDAPSLAPVSTQPSDQTADGAVAPPQSPDAPSSSPQETVADDTTAVALDAASTAMAAIGTAPSTSTTAPTPQPLAMDVANRPTAPSQSKSAEPTAPLVDKALAAGTPSPKTSGQIGTATDVAPVATAPETPPAKPVSAAAKTDVVEVQRLIDPSSPKAEITVSVQPATAAAQTATPAQTAAVVSNLTVAEAVKAVETQAEAAQQAASDTSVPATETAQPSQAAPTKPTATPATPSTPLRSARYNDAPSDVAGLTQDGSEVIPTNHVAMADAASSASQTRQATLGQAAPATDSPTPVALIDAAAPSLDPTAPVDAPAEARALDGATTTAQTATSSLSRATIETTAQLAAQIARKLEGRSTRFDMVLTPEDLGRVDVSLEIGADGQLAARLAFDNPAAAAELRGRADELRRQLQDAGFQVASDSLDFTQRDTSSGGGFDRQQQQRQTMFAGAARLTTQADLPVTPPPGAWTNHSQTRDRVDVRV